MIFRDLEFKTLPICEIGSRFPFEAKLTEDELLDRVNNSSISCCLEVSEALDNGIRCIFIDECGTHIGTYNCESGSLYTGSREIFCQMEG